MTKNNDIFRKSALNKIASLDQMDQAMTVVKPSTVLALISVGIMMIVALLWCIFGSIPETVRGSGVIMNIDKIESIKYPEQGTVKNVFVSRGDKVYSGQVIARIEAASASGSGSTDGTSQIIQVTANSSGSVMEVPVRKGDFVEAGSTIAIIDTSAGDTPIEALVYFSGSDGKKLEPGMKIGLVPGTVKQEEYGYIVGIIMEVSEFPVSREQLVSSLQNPALAESFYQIVNPIEVKVSIVPDPQSYSGYKWSSSRGPEQKIGSGFMCDATVITEIRKPVSLLLPWVRKGFLGIGEKSISKQQ